jgi:hypothetical protein
VFLKLQCQELTRIGQTDNISIPDLKFKSTFSCGLLIFSLMFWTYKVWFGGINELILEKKITELLSVQ